MEVGVTGAGHRDLEEPALGDVVRAVGLHLLAIELDVRDVVVVRLAAAAAGLGEAARDRGVRLFLPLAERELVRGVALGADLRRRVLVEAEQRRRPLRELVVGEVDRVLASWSPVASLGERLERGLLAIEGVRIHGADRPRVGGTINAGFAGALGESIVVALDLAGVAVSTGAACTSGSVQPSPVLLGLGYSPAEAREAVRFSLGHFTTAAEIDQVLGLLPAIVERARRHRAV